MIRSRVLPGCRERLLESPPYPKLPVTALMLRASLAPALALLLVGCGNSEPLGGAAAGLDPRADAARFLTQATFGPAPEEIDALSARRDYGAWLEQQRAAPVSLELPYLQQQNKTLSQSDRLEAWWRFAITGPDQLRQRMAFALSEIMVISDQSSLAGQPEGMAYYYDVLAANALGNFRDLLGQVTVSPAMGHFLNMWHNRKPDPAHGIRADENYAREVMQLFTIGLVQLNADGSQKLDGSGRGIATFSQSEVADMARVLTGWSWGDGSSDSDFNNASGSWTQPMRPYETYHDESAKRIVGDTPIPAHMTAQPELDLALDTLFNHPNVGPFVGRQLIQRLVTSNPSPAYIARVAQAFADNGQGVRGDLFAVARAILLDPEARAAAAPGRGKLREPLLRASHVWRAFHAAAPDGRYDYRQALGAFAESPLSAPSVFNFFRPDFRPGGALSQAGLVAPEFGITTEATVVNTSNELRRIAARYQGSQGASSASSSDILLDFTPWESRAAADPARLVADFDILLTGGGMPAPMRRTLADYVGGIAADQPDARIGDLVYLILSSPQYAAEQ